MNSVEVLLASVLMFSVAMCASIISFDTFADDNSIDSSENDMSIDNLNSIDGGVSNILETMYAIQSFGKSHRFYFTQGERKDGKLNCIVRKKTRI